MKKVLLICSLFITFFACKKDNTNHVTSYGVAVDSLHLTFGHSYQIFFERTQGGVTGTDSGHVIFNANGTVTEISPVFDSSSFTYPDTFIYAVNTSFVYGENWNNLPNAIVWTFNPNYDTMQPHRYLLHDYLRTELVAFYRTEAYVTGNTLIKVTPSLSDTTSVVVGYIK